MNETSPAHRRRTRNGWIVDEYALTDGARLLVPLVPDWQVRKLDIERRRKHLTPAELEED